MKPTSIDIIPALPGYTTIYDFDDSVELGEPVIAWRVETCSSENDEKLFSYCIPLTVDGDVASNCIGVQNPNESITVFEDSTYISLEELQKSKLK